MSKNSEFIEEYKKSLSATVKSIGKNEDLEINFVRENPSIIGNTINLTDPDINNIKNNLDYLRAEADSLALEFRHHSKEIHENFISYIKDRRGSKLSSDEEEIFNGKFWTGIKAHELGLVDGLGSINKILKDRFGEDYKTIVISQKKPFFSLGGNLIEIIVGKVLSIIEERIIWSKFNL